MNAYTTWVIVLLKEEVDGELGDGLRAKLQRELRQHTRGGGQKAWTVVTEPPAKVSGNRAGPQMPRIELFSKVVQLCLARNATIVVGPRHTRCDAVIADEIPAHIEFQSAKR